MLGIPTVLDRFIQQAMLQVLQPLLDPTFSKHSYGFRPGRSAHQAVKAARRHIQEGYRIVVDVDLAQFFDRVNHDVLMSRLAKRIEDKRLLKLVRAYLSAGILSNGVKISRHEGTPQGGPLSPLLANLLLDEVDKTLEGRGHRFVRYADDCNVYVQSKRAGKRVFESLKKIYGRLRLKINEEKSAVDSAFRRQFLGFGFWTRAGKIVECRVGEKARKRMKGRIRKLTSRSCGRSLGEVIEKLRSYLLGWKNYFRLAETPKQFRKLDQWIRHRLRALQLVQWKRGRTIFRKLVGLGVCKEQASQIAGNGRRWWHNSAMLLNRALPNAFFREAGLPSLAT